MKRIIQFLFILTLGFPALAQEGDTSDVFNDNEKMRSFRNFRGQDFILDSIASSKLDSTFTPFFYYEPTLYIYKSNLGNVGTPQKYLSYSNERNVGFKIGMDYLDDFRFQAKNHRYFEVTQPYAKVFYVNGAAKEEGVDIRLSQNVAPDWNNGIEFKRISSEGFYLRQRTAMNRFKIYQSFKTKDRRYGIIANLNYNETSNQENGGITSDSLFKNVPEVNKNAIDVNFSNAINTSRNMEVYAFHFLNIGKINKTYYRDENDSLYPDSVIATKVAPTLSIFHEFRYNTADYHFDDEAVDSLNYLNANLSDGAKVNDHTQTRITENKAGVRLRPFKNKSSFFYGFGLDLIAGYQYLEYIQRNHRIDRTIASSYLTNTTLGAKLNNPNYRKYHLSGEYNMVVSGFDQGDWQFKGISDNKIAGMKFRGELKLESLNPDLIFRQFNSTTISWGNELKNVNRTYAAFDFALPKVSFNVGATYDLVGNHTYFNEMGQVSQFGNELSILQLYLKQHFKLWLFHLNVDIRYQTVDKEGVINIPELMTFSSFYLESTLFKKDMLYRIGTDVYMASDYNGDSYNPVTRQYQTQNSVKVNSYPFMDVYLMVNVDRFYFFAKLANALQGAAPYNYFSAPGYPMPDRAFKFGIKWEFLN